ncbi:MAG: LppP/LprE family lipoprotein [Acidimicrobiales bacterium]
MSLGYRVVSSSPAGSSGPLSVLIGDCANPANPAGGYCQQAFFFNANTYIGTATFSPVLLVSVVSDSGTSVTLAYPQCTMNGSVPFCPAGGGTQFYTFTLNPNGTSVTPAPTLPSDPNLSR